MGRELRMQNESIARHESKERKNELVSARLRGKPNYVTAAD